MPASPRGEFIATAYPVGPDGRHRSSVLDSTAPSGRAPTRPRLGPPADDGASRYLALGRRLRTINNFGPSVRAGPPASACDRAHGPIHFTE